MTSLIIALLLFLVILLVMRLIVQEVLYALFPEKLATRALRAVDYTGRVVAIDSDKDTVMMVVEIQRSKLQFVMS